MARQADGSTDTLESDIEHVCQPAAPQVTQLWYKKLDNTATSYVVAMFHPTIGQCAHQSLSNTATPELGMISSRNKGTLANSYIAKGATKLSQANTVGFIML